MGINPTESYCSWSTKQRQFQVKGKVTRMDLKRGCVLSARGAVSLGQGSHTIMTILRKTSTSPGRKGYRNSIKQTFLFCYNKIQQNEK